MTPYWQSKDGRLVIRNEDAIEALHGWDGPLVSCVLTDPPYCSGASEAARRGKRAGLTPESVTERPLIQMDDLGMLAYEWMARRWFLWARRLTVSGGHLACFTDWRMAPWVQLMMETAGWRSSNVIVWDKMSPGLGSGFRAQHELIVIGSNGQPEWHSYAYGNVLRSMRLTATDHPHQKPTDLLQQIIETCAPDDGLVLDPFMGSGSTLVAARNAGRRAIGLDVAENHCATAAKRLEDPPLLAAIGAEQGALFGEPA